MIGAFGTFFMLYFIWIKWERLMDYEINENIIRIRLDGRIDSNNHNEIYERIKEILDNNSFSDLVLDFKDVNYISSAGLRVMLKIKKEFGSLSIVNVSIDVYEIFDMTGFTQLIEIKKASRFVSVKGAKVIGDGYYSTVYKIDSDTIIKVFNRTSDDQQIERELRRAKDAFVSGIPTAISFDIVEVEDGKKGVQFELIDARPLRDCFRDDRDKYDFWLEKYVELLKTINTTECCDHEVTDMKDFYIEKVEYIKDNLGQDYEKVLSLVKGIKDSNTFVHGDCHFKNILVQGEELLLIDMDTLSKGNPIFELTALRFAYLVFNELEKGNSEIFFEMKEEFCAKLYDDIIEKYYSNINQIDKDKIAMLSYIQMAWWNRVENAGEEKLEKCLKNINNLLSRVNDLNI